MRQRHAERLGNHLRSGRGPEELTAAAGRGAGAAAELRRLGEGSIGGDRHDVVRHDTLGREPVLHVKVDPSLIAGIVIRVGDRVYDSSVNTQFNLARKAMIERAVDLIETQPEKFLQLTS